MNPRKSPLRGGTAFELYQYPYYVGFQHGTYMKGKWGTRYYAAHIVILCVEPFRIVYVSDPLQAHPDIYAEFNETRVYSVMKGEFIFPVGLMFETKDSAVIGATVNDVGGTVLRMTGIDQLVSSVIAMDKDKTYQNPVFSIQNYLLERSKVLKIILNQEIKARHN